MDEARQDNYFESPKYQFFRRHLGDPAANPAKFDAISPLRHVDKVKIPIFIYHGWDDPIASIAESKALVSALAAHNIPYEKHFLEREGHGISDYEDRLDMFGDVEAFLAKYMTPAKTAGAGGPTTGALTAR
jgi:dipeptidyl aminopeptidase/acylaminoacyl peptidase